MYPAAPTAPPLRPRRRPDRPAAPPPLAHPARQARLCCRRPRGNRRPSSPARPPSPPSTPARPPPCTSRRSRPAPWPARTSAPAATARRPGPARPAATASVVHKPQPEAPRRTDTPRREPVSRRPSSAWSTGTTPRPSSYAPAVRSFVVDTTWASVQPVQGGPIVHPNAIDNAIALAKTNGMALKLRVAAGIDAPTWAKNLDGAADHLLLHARDGGPRRHGRRHRRPLLDREVTAAATPTCRPSWPRRTTVCPRSARPR